MSILGMAVFPAISDDKLSAPGSSCFLFITPQGEGAHGNHGRLCQAGPVSDLPRGILALDAGELRASPEPLRRSRRIPRRSAWSSTRDAPPHAIALRGSAKIGSSTWKVAPLP